MNKNKMTLPKYGDIVEITARHCSDKVSPRLRVGQRYIVMNTATLKDGTPVVEVAHPTRKRDVLRMNAVRFDWKAVTPESLRNECFNERVTETAEKMLSEFTRDEQMRIAFVPLIFNHIAWIYAMKAAQKSADYRVDMLKKTTRRVRELRLEYEREVEKELGRDLRRLVEEQTERFMAEFQRDFTILYFTVNQEFKKKMPTWPYDDLRTYAIISMLVIRFADDYNRRMDKFVASRVGQVKSRVRMPIMDALHTCMDAYAGEVGRFNYGDANVKMAMNVIANDVNKIEFQYL